MRNILKLFAVSGLVVMEVISGCMKDKLQEDGFTNPDFSGSPNLIEIPGPTRTNNRYSTSYAVSLMLSNKDTTFDVVYVRLAADQPAPEDIEVQLELDPSLLVRYNDTLKTKLVEPAKSIYTFSNPDLKITIPKGSRQGALQMKVKPFDISVGEFGFGFRVKSISKQGYRISGNFDHSVTIVGVRNDYDGTYDYKGYALRAGDATLTGNFTGAEMDLITTGPNSVIFSDVPLWGDGQTGIAVEELELAIDPVTYKVTITSAGGAINDPAYNSRYDPATKTFFISFTWGAGPAARLGTDTLTYREPRP